MTIGPLRRIGTSVNRNEKILQDTYIPMDTCPRRPVLWGFHGLHHVADDETVATTAR